LGGIHTSRAPESFRSLLLRHRGRTGLIQRDLAARAGVSLRSVQDWEAGVTLPRAERLQGLVRALLEAGGFTPGQESSEARELWTAAAREAPRMHSPFDEEWFAGLLADNTTIWAWNSQAGTYYTHYESWTNEGRLERDGRYIAVSNGNTQFRLWDLSTNTFGPVQYDPSYWLAHNANLRGMWLTSNVYDHNPAHFDSYVPSGDQIVRTRLPNSASAGYGVHHAGNWVQSDAELGGNLNRQWAFVGSWDRSDITVNAAIQQGLGVYRADGSDTRLIAHTYDVNPDYYATEFVMPSPDGKVVIFNSNMQSSGRYDLFVAEMPLGGSPPPPPPPSTQNVVWTNLTNVTANGNSVMKTSGCDGCTDAGPISSQTIISGDGYVEFQFSANAALVAAGLSNGSTDNSYPDIDFGIVRLGGAAVEVRENGVYKGETAFDATAVAENRRALRAAAGLPAEPAWLEQVHGTHVMDLDSQAPAASPAHPADAAVTRQSGRVCAILTADCLPVLLANDAGDRVGAAHAGWRGLAAGVIEATVSALGGPPGELSAWLGPAIGPRHFEVGAEAQLVAAPAGGIPGPQHVRLGRDAQGGADAPQPIERRREHWRDPGAGREIEPRREIGAQSVLE